MLTDEQRQQIESLYRRFGKGVGSYVLTRTGDRNLAESITARVFLIVVRRFDQCTGNVVAWLWSIVRSELARHFRDRKVHEPIAGHSASAAAVDPADRTRDPASQAEQADLAARTRWALEQLDEPAHSLVYMKFFLEMSNTDIAEALQMTTGNVGVSAHRALKKLKELMESKPFGLPIHHEGTKDTKAHEEESIAYRLSNGSKLAIARLSQRPLSSS